MTAHLNLPRAEFFDEITPLHALDWWDGPTSILAVYRGQFVELAADPNSEGRGWRVFTIHPLTDEEGAQALRRAESFAGAVGRHMTYVDGWQINRRAFSEAGNPKWRDWFDNKDAQPPSGLPPERRPPIAWCSRSPHGRRCRSLRYLAARA